MRNVNLKHFSSFSWFFNFKIVVLSLDDCEDLDLQPRLAIKRTMNLLVPNDKLFSALFSQNQCPGL